MGWLTENPRTTSLGVAAVVVAIACSLKWLSPKECEVAVLALLAALGVTAKDA